MKPTIQVINNELDNGYIVIMEKDLGKDNHDMFGKQREVKKFKTSEKQVFIDTIESVVVNLLGVYGIIPYDTTKCSLESAFDTLKCKYGLTIEIVDRYKDTKETIVHRENLITIIIENGVLSMAQEVRFKGV